MRKIKHRFFLIFFGLSIVIFLWRLIFMRGSFLEGDYYAQFYPWLKIYSESIKQLHFPFWTRYMHSGFPLMAEGQIGGFYPLNIVLFFLMPFDFAYNYSIILHFAIAGGCTYLYARKLGAEEQGAALAAFLFCFGSSFAGCFYNIVTLRTLAWFPLVLLLIEIFVERGRKKFLIAAGCIAGMQFLAGFIQMAAYSLVFYFIYLFYKARLKKTFFRNGILAAPVFLIPAFIVALPQLLITLGLAQVSGRMGLSLDFALWKSFPPPCLLGVFFPRWTQFQGADVYTGVLGVFLMIYALSYLKRYPAIRPIALVGFCAALAAFGKYDPLYVMLLKVTGFYAFRNPSKFLFFSLFAASVLAGLGFSLFSGKDKKLNRLPAQIFIIISGFSLAVFFLGRFVLLRFKDKIVAALQDYATSHIFGKAYHKYDLQTYIQKAKGLYDSWLAGCSFNDIFVIFSLVFMVLGLIVVITAYKRPALVKRLKNLILAIIFIDIFIYSFYGLSFRGNIRSYDFLRPTQERILNIIISDKELFRIAPFDIRSPAMLKWANPNANALFGLDSIAAYSPMVARDYRESLSGLEAVDDSLGVLSPSDSAVRDYCHMLRFLNVKYLISAHELTDGCLERLTEEEGVFLYRLRNFIPRLFFLQALNDDSPEAGAAVKLLNYRDGFASVGLSAERDGFLVFSEYNYPGWQAFVDNRKTEIIRAQNILMAVKITKGTHRVVFKYQPEFLPEGVHH